ncbi:MAG TPA: hypothetical protein GX735_07670 [Firmicutes bacterium]|nr:hypothetical protein [Bacillota bacterium]
MKIFFAYDGFPVAREKIRAQLPEPNFAISVVDPERSILEQVGDVDVIIPGMASITAEVMDAAPRLKLIVQFGVGLEGVDMEAARRRGIYVSNTPGVNAAAVAEHALFLMLALARRLPVAQGALGEGQIGFPVGRELSGKTVGIIGFGNSGRELARMARGLGMRVLAIRRTPGEDDRALVDFIGTRADLDKVLAESDFVSLHAPLTPETEGLIDAAALARMKPSAFLVNVARGGLVVREDLLAALRTGVIAGAGLDVFWTEPPDPNDKLFTLENVVVTPHIAGVTEEAYGRAARQVAAHIRNLVREGKPEFYY